MKRLSLPRLWLFGAALLILVLSACGAPLAGDSWAGISTDGKYVYVAWKNQVLRVNPTAFPGDPATKRRIDWLGKAPADSVHMYAAPALADDGTIYVGAYDHKVYAFSLTSGLLSTWNNPAANDKIVGGALVKDNLVYVGMGDKGVRALDRKTGAPTWTFLDTAYGVWSTPIVVGDTLYFGSLDHNVYALDAANGTFKWKLDLGGAVAGTPLIDNGILYVGTFANKLYAVSLEDHKIIHQFDTEGWVWGTPLLYNGLLYFGDLNGWIYALNLQTFDVKWKKNDPEHPGAIRGALAEAKTKDKYIIIAGSENKHLYAYEAQSGDLVWTTGVLTDDQILSDLVVIGSDVICTTLKEDQIVVAFNIETGQKSWEVKLSDELTRIQTATNVPVSNVPATTPTAAATSQQ